MFLSCPSKPGYTLFVKCQVANSPIYSSKGHRFRMSLTFLWLNFRLVPRFSRNWRLWLWKDKPHCSFLDSRHPLDVLLPFSGTGWDNLQSLPAHAFCEVWELTTFVKIPVTQYWSYQGLNLGPSLTGWVCYHYTIGLSYHLCGGMALLLFNPPFPPPPAHRSVSVWQTPGLLPRADKRHRFSMAWAPGQTGHWYAELCVMIYVM